MEISVNLFASESAVAKRSVRTETLITAFGSKSTYSTALSWQTKLVAYTKDLAKIDAKQKRSSAKKLPVDEAKRKKALVRKIALAKHMRGLYMAALDLGGFIPATATTIQRSRAGSDMYPVGKKVRLEIQKAPGAVKPRANQDKASEVSGPELLNSLLKKHTLYQVDGKAIIKAVHVGGGRQAAQLLCDITSITKTSATVNSPVFGKVKFALTPAGVKKLMDAVSDATGGRYGAFKSESSAGSEKAKKMGLISAGFGRYRSKEGGPITHKIVDGKLVKAPASGNSSGAKTSDYVIQNLNFPMCKSVKDMLAHIAKKGNKKLTVIGEAHATAHLPVRCGLRGSKADLEQFLKSHVKDVPTDSKAKIESVDSIQKLLAPVTKAHNDSVDESSKKDTSTKKRLAELEGEIKNMRKQLLKEYRDDLEDEDDYDADDADDYVADDDDMRKLLDEKYRLTKRLKKK